MVKIRLRRSGSKHRPFYRVVVAKSTAGRDGAFIEIIGTYNPVTKPKLINIKEDRAIHWLLEGAQPSETAAIIMNRVGILEKYFEQRPSAKKSYKFLDKRTSSMSVQSVIKAAPVETAAKPEPVAETAPVVAEVVETPVETVAVEAVVETAPEVVAEAPVEAIVEEIVEAPAETATDIEAVAPEGPIAELTASADAVADETATVDAVTEEAAPQA